MIHVVSQQVCSYRRQTVVYEAKNTVERRFPTVWWW